MSKTKHTKADQPKTEAPLIPVYALCALRNSEGALLYSFPAEALDTPSLAAYVDGDRFYIAERHVVEIDVFLARRKRDGYKQGAARSTAVLTFGLSRTPGESESKGLSCVPLEFLNDPDKWVDLFHQFLYGAHLLPREGRLDLDLITGSFTVTLPPEE